MDLNQFKIGLLVVLSIVGAALIGSKRIAGLFESSTLRWIKAFKRIKAEWRKPLTIEKPPEPPQSRKGKKSS
jgi:Sec-independent protein translocase protein TatA